MKTAKYVFAIFLAAALPLAVLAFSAESNETETDVIFDANLNIDTNVPVNENINRPAHAPKPEPEPTPPAPAAKTPAPPAPAVEPAPLPAPAPEPAPESAAVPPPANVPAPNGSASARNPASSAPIAAVAGRIAKQVTQAAASVDQAVRQAAQTVDEQVIQNPQVQTANNEIIAPAATLATTAVAASVNLPHVIYFFYFLFLQPVALLDRRRGKWTGVVYNAFTKLPVNLALVRLLDAKTGALVQTRVTDGTGRYLFFAPEGQYRISVTRNGYVFPSPTMKGAASDATYSDLYHGGVISSYGTPIAPNIPLEPVGSDLTIREVIKARNSLTLKHVIASSTTVLGLIVLFITPNLWTGINFVLQLLVLAAVERYVFKEMVKKTGRILDANGRPIRAVVRLFETTYNKVVETMVTDNSGRFAFLVGPNRYYVVAETDSGQAKSAILDFASGQGEMVVGPQLKIA